MNKKMDFKKVLVSFLAIASLLLLTATVSAYTVNEGLTNGLVLKIDNVQVADELATSYGTMSVTAGDSISVRVEFTALANASDVRLRAELEGSEGDATAVTPYFDVEAGNTYVKTLTLKVPQVDKDELSEVITLNLRIWNSDDETEVEDLDLNVQRTAYEADLVSVNVNSNVKAGESFPVEVVIKNTGYNDLEDMYVTAKISALGVEKRVFIGDLLDLVEADAEDESTTVSGKLILSVPYTAKAGKYLVEVEASNAETSSTDSVEITVQNDFPEAVMKTSTGLLFVNPTNDLKVYRVVLSEGEKIVSVQAGDSESVDVKASTEDYVVSVMTLNGEVVGNFTFKASEQTSLTTGNSIVVLTVILGIVFFVLLVVLIVLLSKKPQKSEDSESYY